MFQGFIPAVDLLTSVGLLLLVSAVMIDFMLAVVVYRSNPKSATNKTFFFLSISAALWLSTYTVYLPEFSLPPLLMARLGIFFAAPMSALFFLLAHTIPYEKFQLKRSIFFAIIISTLIVMILNISPYGFTSAEITGGQLNIKPGIGFAPFAVLSTLFSVLAVYILFKKFRMSVDEIKKQLRLILIGILLMLALIIITIQLPIIIYRSGLLVPLMPVYTLIFLGMTAYAIVRHHLFSLKIIATESFTVLLCIILLSRVFTSSSPGELFLNLMIAVAMIGFGTLLIKSVRQEVRQRVELEKLSRFKTQLLSLVSHQIRSPLAAIKGFISLLVDGSYGHLGDKPKETMGKVKAAADGLVELVNSLLDFRKIEEGKMEYKFEATDIVKLVKDVIEELKPLATNKKLELTAAPSEASVLVNADAQKLRQVILNIVDNAIKYTHSGFVKLEIKTDGDKVIVSVTDSGLGIDPELLSRVFEEFVRGEGIKNKIRGTGLGLYIAKSITEAHGGKIWAESPGDGKGSSFFVELKKLKR